MRSPGRHTTLTDGTGTTTSFDQSEAGSTPHDITADGCVCDGANGLSSDRHWSRARIRTLGKAEARPDLEHRRGRAGRARK